MPSWYFGEYVIKDLKEIIFLSRNINGSACKQVLKFYKENINEYPSKFFQPDDMRCQSSKLSQNMIKFLFKNKFIPALIMIKK